MARLPDAEREALCGLGTRRIVAQNAYLFFEGDSAGEVYLVERGSLRVVMTSYNGREAILAQRASGELVGELSAFDGAPRSAALIANEESTVIAIGNARFRDAVECRPALVRFFLHELSAKLRASDITILASNSSDVRTRVVAKLVSLSVATVEYGDAPGPIQLDLSQSDLASWVGTTRESVSRILSDLRAHGTLQTGRGRIEIPSIDALRASIDTESTWL